MIKLSTQANIRLLDNQKVLFKADFTLSKQYGRNKDIPDEVRTLRGDDVMSGNATVTDATSSSGSFSVGSAIINSFSITLNNFDDRFSLYDFTGATMKVYIGIPLVDFVTNEDDKKQVEWVSKGLYTVDKPTTIGNTIPLTLLDNMSKFEVLFSKVGKISKNATLSTYVSTICTYCGVRIGTNVPNPNWTIKERPTDESLTCLDIIGYIAQINGCYARINREGLLEFKWYDASQFKVGVTTEYDGGTFLTPTTPYSDGVNLEGGSFDGSSKEYTDEEGVQRVRYANPNTDYDGGAFIWGNYHVVQAFQSFSVGTDIIKITGIEFTIENLEENAKEPTSTYLYDANGIIKDTETDRKNNAMEYCLSITDNKMLALLNQQADCLAYISKKICGTTIVPFTVSTLSNPSFEAGDCIRLLSNKGDVYDSFITSISYPLNGYVTLNCDAETPNEKQSVQSTPLSTAIANVRTETTKKINYYEEGVKRLNQLSANALGFYSSTVEQADGSRIEYMHDKETLEASLNAYMISSTGFFIGNRVKTTDEWTWVGGVDMSANAVYKTLVADGIDANEINVTNLNASEITSGTLTVGGKTGNTNGSILIKDSTGKTLITLNKNGMTLDSSVKISFSGNVDNDADVITNKNKGTYITKNYIETLKIKADSVDAEDINAGTITACQFGDGGTKTSAKSSTKINIKTSTDVGLTFGTNLGFPNALCVISKSTDNRDYAHGNGTICVCSQKVTHGTDDRNGLFMSMAEINHYDWSRTTSGAYSGIEFQNTRIFAKNDDWSVNGHVVTTSDIRLKDNIQDFSVSVIRKLISKLNFKSFDFKKNKKRGYGFIAQEVQEICNELDIDTESILYEEDGYYKLSYENIDRFCIPAVKDLYEICEEQQKEIESLKYEVEELKSIVKELINK